MKRKSLSFLAVSLIATILFLQTSLTKSFAANINQQVYTNTNFAPMKEWDQVFGGNGSESFESVIETIEGNYIAIGSSSPTDTWSYLFEGNHQVQNFGNVEGLITDFYTNGEYKYIGLFGSVYSDSFHSVVQTRDGGYIVAGSTSSSNYGYIQDENNGATDGLLMKFTSHYLREWDQVFGGTMQDSFHDVLQTDDGGYVGVGITFSSDSGEIKGINNGSADGLMVKFDANGNREWDQVYGGISDDVFSSIIQTDDGGFLVIGSTKSSMSGDISEYNNGDYDGLLVKFDSVGNRIWDRVIGGAGSDLFSSIIQTADGGYVVVGFTESSGTGEINDISNGYTDGLLLKFDSLGNKVWDQVYGGNYRDYFSSVVQIDDGGYIVAGYSGSSGTGEISDINNGNDDGLLVKFDSEGNRVWDFLFGGNGYDIFSSIIITTSGGYVVAGQTNASPTGDITDTYNGSGDGLLVKFEHTNSLPIFIKHPSDYTVIEEEIVEFSIVGMGTPEPSVQWQMSEDDGITWVDISGATSTTLSFTAKLSDNGSNYRAILTNAEGSTISNTAILTVKSLQIWPLLIEQPTDQTVTEWQTVTFTSAASGTPTPSVQWQVSSDAGSTWNDILGATTTTLSFITTLNDSGNQYRAVYTNSIGSVISDVANLLVNKKTTSMVTVSSNNLDWGIVSGGGEYSIGEIVKVNAIANYGFSFIGWQENGAVVSTSSTYRFKIGIQDRELIAIFLPNWPKDIKLYGTSLSANSVALGLSKPVVGATKYVIYYGENRIEKIASEGINWIIEGLEIAKSYTFTVQAIYFEAIETINGPSVTIRMKR